MNNDYGDKFRLIKEADEYVEFDFKKGGFVKPLISKEDDYIGACLDDDAGFTKWANALNGSSAKPEEETNTEHTKPQEKNAHYSNMELEPIEVTDWLLDLLEVRVSPKEGHLIATVITYAMRQGRKAGTDDAKKARDYMRRAKTGSF